MLQDKTDCWLCEHQPGTDAELSPPPLNAITGPRKLISRDLGKDSHLGNSGIFNADGSVLYSREAKQLHDIHWLLQWKGTKLFRCMGEDIFSLPSASVSSLGQEEYSCGIPCMGLSSQGQVRVKIML